MTKRTGEHVHPQVREAQKSAFFYSSTSNVLSPPQGSGMKASNVNSNLSWELGSRTACGCRCRETRCRRAVGRYMGCTILLALIPRQTASEALGKLTAVSSSSFSVPLAAWRSSGWCISHANPPHLRVGIIVNPISAQSPAAPTDSRSLPARNRKHLGEASGGEASGGEAAGGAPGKSHRSSLTLGWRVSSVQAFTWASVFVILGVASATQGQCLGQPGL